MEPIAAVCAAGFLIAILAHVFLVPPPHIKRPEPMLLGSLTFLTVQSNLICYYYSFMRLLAPDGEIVRLDIKSTHKHQLCYAPRVRISSKNSF